MKNRPDSRINWFCRSGQVRLVNRYHGDRGFQVHPQANSRCNRGVRSNAAKNTARSRIFRRRIPSQSATNCLRALDAGQMAPRSPGRKERVCARDLVFRSARISRGKTQKVGHIGEKPRMARRSVQHPGVLVLDLALDAAMAESCVFFRRRDRADGRWRAKSVAFIPSG